MNNSLTTAAFMTIGLSTSAASRTASSPATLGAVLNHWQQGMVELVDELVKHAPYADALIDTGFQVKGDVPGVAAYEVAEEFGDWFAQQIVAAAQPGTAPDEATCRAKLRELALAFYNGDAQLAETLQAVALMKHFEVLAVGFDGSTDETDDRVFWVCATDRAQLDEALQGVEVKEVSELDPALKLSMIDFTLPGDREALRGALTRFAIESTPNDCSDCGATVPSLLLCPDGAEVCADCEHRH